MRSGFSGLILLSLAACASSPNGGSDRPNVITGDQVAEADRANLLNVVQILRPEWLVLDRRQRRVHILIDDDPHSGGLGGGFLERMTQEGIVEMEYLAPPEARETFPDPPREYGAGIIILRTKPRGRSQRL